MCHVARDDPVLAGGRVRAPRVDDDAIARCLWRAHAGAVGAAVPGNPPLDPRYQPYPVVSDSWHEPSQVPPAGRSGPPRRVPKVEGRHERVGAHEAPPTGGATSRIWPDVKAGPPPPRRPRRLFPASIHRLGAPAALRAARPR